MDNNSVDAIRKKYPSRIARAKAIKLYCKESCSAGDTESWKNCTFDACFLWNFRLGREVLGNRTSFKKHRGKALNSSKNSIVEGTSTQLTKGEENGIE